MFKGCLAGKEAWTPDYEAALTSSDGTAGAETAPAFDSSSSVSASSSSAGAASKRLGGEGGSGFFSSGGAVVGVDGLLPAMACPDFFFAAATAAFVASLASSSAAFTVYTISLIEPSIVS